MVKKIISITIIALIVGGIFFVLLERDVENEFVTLDSYTTRVMDMNGTEVKMYVANSPDLIVKGLSNVESLGEDEGMVFIYPEEGERMFWMKDMNFPLDILWSDSEGKVVHIEENVSPDDYPKTYGKGTSAQYVMEFNAGFVERIGVE